MVVTLQMFIKPHDKQGDTALRLDVYALYKAIRDYGMGIVPEDMPYFDRMRNTMPEIEADDTVKQQAPLTSEEEEELETASHESGAATSRIQPAVRARVDALIDEAKNALPPSPKRRRVEWLHSA